ncbi:hypothetical protein [Arsenophonus endosymbiont of Aleurodicus floccissimus]|uniref:hypothetical protein n=1 Tax=Arsenophonus endosymbiont of Aleurodicus floccissimus TaxID=2152761 RepID=UPI00160369BF|nr:hypothetical protein [Arsenophonus endosymbiont of Aleurodicus floccissimus]
MTPEIIALLHFTHLLPYLAVSIKGGVQSGLVSSLAPFFFYRLGNQYNRRLCSNLG